MRLKTFQNVVFSLRRRGLSDVGYAYYVGKYPGGCHFSPGSVAFDDHGVLFVTLGGEQDDVVAAFEGIERVVVAYAFESYADSSVFEGRDEPEMLILGLCLGTLAFKLAVERLDVSKNCSMVPSKYFSGTNRLRTTSVWSTL